MTLKYIPIFRILLILILTGFLYIYYAQMDIGRYQAIPGGMLVDTKTGETFMQKGEQKTDYYSQWQKLIAPVSK